MTILKSNTSGTTRERTVLVTIRSEPAYSYPILIGETLLDDIGIILKDQLGSRRCFVVSDVNVYQHYGARLENALAQTGHTLLGHSILPAGESTKNFTELSRLLSAMLKSGIDRQSLVLALGGGVIGDLAGLASSLCMRGVDVVQIPTTLLSQVDSAVGGKTGLDTEYGKNTIGSFYQPRLVLSDVSTLKTLPLRERRAGYGEVIKYGIGFDRKFFEWCVEHERELQKDDPDALGYIIERSCALKASIVERDEKEKGERALLNLGHTFGHALETLSGYSGALLHGEAVAIGMVLALHLSLRMSLITEDEVRRCVSHFKAMGLTLAPPDACRSEGELLKLMQRDKKSRNGELNLILCQGLGRAVHGEKIAPEPVLRLWQDYFKGQLF